MPHEIESFITIRESGVIDLVFLPFYLVVSWWWQHNFISWKFIVHFQQPS
jgi:hypothetical protein